MKNDKQFKVVHGRAKWNWVHGHRIGLVVTESVEKPKVISQERLAEIQELQLQLGDVREQLALRMESVRNDLAEGLPVEEGPFEAHME